MITDPISDLLARLHNAYLAKKDSLIVTFSRVNYAILEILKEEGYISSLKMQDQQQVKSIIIELKYIQATPALSGVKRLSKPGRRLYSVASDIPKTLGGYGITVLSTNKGLMTDKQAKQKNLGGELICQVW